MADTCFGGIGSDIAKSGSPHAAHEHRVSAGVSCVRGHQRCMGIQCGIVIYSIFATDHDCDNDSLYCSHGGASGGHDPRAVCLLCSRCNNQLLLFGGPPRDFVKDAIRGYTGYFQGKNYMGGFAGVALLLSLHEVLYPGRRRAFGAIIGVLALVLLVLSNSKTALGLAFIAPLLAAFAVAARKMRRLFAGDHSSGYCAGLPGHSERLWVQCL